MKKSPHSLIARFTTACAVALCAMSLPSPTDAQTFPDAPSNLTASAVSPFQIGLSWADVSTNESGFLVEQSLDGINFTQVAQVSSNITSYRTAPLFPSTTYSFRVRAYNVSGASVYSPVASADTPAPACPLSVVGWGYDGDGEVSMPATLTNVVAVSAGGAHGLALLGDGTVAGWGYDGYGEATPPAGLSNVLAIAAGGYHSLALQSDGTVVAWGYNVDGETSVPAGLSNVVAIAAGDYHSLALRSDGTVIGWGYNVYGQTSVPATLSNVVAISAGYFHSMALQSDGTVVAWGYNCCGQTSPPTNLTGVVAIVAGGFHNLALQSNGTVVAWGYNGYGETTIPSGLNDVVAIGAGLFHSLALRSDGTVIGWGQNDEGEATAPPGGEGMATISGGGNEFSLALAQAPTPPSVLTATATTTNEIDLSWSEYSSNVQGFEIDRAPDAGGSPGVWVILATNASSVTTYSDIGASTNAAYWYRVLTYNDCGASPYSALRIPSTLILDDTWSSGMRTNQNPPTSSAWWTSVPGSLNSATNSMTLTVGGNSAQAITYFTSTNGSPPVQLNVGDTLTATFTLVFGGVWPSGSSSQGFRFGLFDFADGSNMPVRVSSDGTSVGSQGSYVQGYSLFGKVYGTFSDATPIDIRKRTTLSDSALLGTSADWTSLAKNSLVTSSFAGFANLTPYTLQFVLQRTSLNSMLITITWSNTLTGATLSESVTDSTASDFSFDGVAYRPSNNTTAPATNEFVEVNIQLSSAPVGPSTATEPQSQTVFDGQTATFSVVPNGTTPLSYQWYYNNNTPVANATNATLALGTVHPANAGCYSVLISNLYGTVTSAPAQLTVSAAPPSITTQPQGLTVIPGQFATFSVVASGSPPLSYQWYFNTNTLLASATGASLILTNVQSDNAGIYSVIVSNAAGSITSSNAVLTVNTNSAAPVFIVQPVSVLVYAGANVSFGAAAVGTQPISYQWTKNSTPVPGATLTTLSLTNVQPADAGTYTLVASNSVGSTISSNAMLTVKVRQPPRPVSIPTNQYNVINFGAVGDGVTDNATAIQSCIASAAVTGGTIEIPTNGTLNTYLSGPIVLSTNMNLQVDAGVTLQMLPRSNWPGTTTFITGTGLHDVEISGLGTIDGQGTNWWFPLASSRPNFISFSGCTNVLIQDVTLQNPPTFHLMLKGSNAGLTIQGITINTPFSAPNTDGMDLASTNVLIQNCYISDGDDNIEIGGSSGLAADITISNCTFGTGHGVSIGGYTQGGISDLLVSNCTWIGTEYGIKMKTDRDRGGLIENLKYCNLTMTNVNFAFAFYDYYDSLGSPSRSFTVAPSDAASDPGQPITSTTPVFQNVTISDLTAVGNNGIQGPGNIAGIIYGLPEMPISNVTLCRVNILGRTNDGTVCMYNVQGIQIIDSNLTAPLTGTNVLTLYNAHVTISNSVANPNQMTITGMGSPSNSVLSLFNSQAAVTDGSILGANPFLTLGASTLAVSSDLNLGGASTLNVGIGTNATGVAVAGNLALGGILNLGDGGGFTNGMYTLFTYSGALTWNGLSIGATPTTNFTYAISTNIAGIVSLVVGGANPPQDPFAAWQSQYFNCTNCPLAQANADPLGTGMSNTNRFLAGFNPTNSTTYLHVIRVTKSSSDIVVTYLGASGDSTYAPGVASRTNVLEYTSGSAGGSYATNFTSTGQTNILSGGTGLGTVTNMTDLGGATNFPSRYYRVRVLLP
ncbi:MAG TPA: glycosyl hydrolase family 28 protein [Verrucomicrobiae bacterium]|nr:glycosyl hydrolase family 28 protein [Verrucomicrobiae bacterium]